MALASICGWLLSALFICAVGFTELPSLPFAIVVVEASGVRHRTYRRQPSKRSSRLRYLPISIPEVAINDSIIAIVKEQKKKQERKQQHYQTYHESAKLLMDAIAYDREQKERKQQQRRQSSPFDEISSNTVIPEVHRPMEGIYTDKPVLRGKFHKWGAILYPPLLGLPLFLKARPSPQATSAALLFSLAIELVMVFSARLHLVQWKTLGSFQTARNLDFMGIFLGIACLYSSLGRLLMGGLHPVLWIAIEGLVWTSSVAGTVFKWRTPKPIPPAIIGALFLVLCGVFLPCLPSLLASASWSVTGGIVGGAVFGFLGTLAFIFQWPNNHTDVADVNSTTRTRPQREIVFGPHEMFHVGTLFTFVSFWVSMWSKISELV